MSVSAQNELPVNLEAEQALLGALLAQNSIYEHVADIVMPEHFAEPVHAELYSAIATCVQAGQPATPITLRNQFENHPALAEVGHAKYLARLVGSAVSLYGCDGYAKYIREMYIRREIMAVCETARLDAVDVRDETSPNKIIEDMESRLFDLSVSPGEKRRGAFIGNLAVHTIKDIESACGGPQGLVGATTGIQAIDRMTGGMKAGQLWIIGGRPGMGKAQPINAKILMANGYWRPMGEIRFGDKLASVDGNASMVNGIYPRGKRQIYKITLSDRRTTRCCADHLWKVNSSKFANKSKILATKEIMRMLEKERYRRRMSLPAISGIFGCDDDILADPWLLGAMIGNGAVSSDHFSISTADAATLFRVQKVAGMDYVTQPGSNGYDYTISRKSPCNIYAAMSEYGLIGKRSHEKFIPKQYLSATRETRLELLRGLLDTDGWVEKFGVIRYSTSSPQLAQDLQYLVRSLGGSCTLSVKMPKYTLNGKKCVGLPHTVCNIRHIDRPSLISLRRKQRRCENVAAFKAPTIISIEPDGEEDVQCITVTHQSHLYITDDFIVTHNSAVAGNIALKCAHAGNGVVFDSREMSAMELATRTLSGWAYSTTCPVPYSDALHGRLDSRQRARLEDTATDLQDIPLYIDDEPGRTMAGLRLMLRRVVRQFEAIGKPLRVVFIDYLQLIKGSGNFRGNRVQEVGEISRSLKELAREFDVCVVAMSQLSRAVEQRENKRPQMSDLRETGDIEQDADLIAFVYREYYYLKDDPKADPDKVISCENEVEFIIAKQRNGATQKIPLFFDAQHGLISDKVGF